MLYPATFKFHHPHPPIVLSSFDFNITTLFWKDEGMQFGRYAQKIPSHGKTPHFSGLEFNVALDGNSTHPLKKKTCLLSFMLLTDS